MRVQRLMAKRLTAILFSTCLLVVVSWPAYGQAKILRVCADPDNLPFTSSESDMKGMYLELAEALANRLGHTIEYFWWRNVQGGRSIRLTLLAGRCDLYVGLPYGRGFMGTRIILTRPFFETRYVIVAPKSASISSLDDLRGKTVGVQFSSPPQSLLATSGGVDTVTFLSPEEAIDALGRGEIQIAFIWGPTAGYYNKHRLQGAFQIIPTAGPGLHWQVAIGVRKTDRALKVELDRAIDQLEPTIAELAEKYGFPVGKPLDLWPRRESSPNRGRRHGSLWSGGMINRVNGNAIVIREGNSLFNQYCGHCHGPDATSAELRTNLRRFHNRYPQNSDQVFYTTMMRGRPEKGMPRWADVLSDEQIRKIKAFLDSIQTK